MRLRSKGLGRREMVMDFREYEVRLVDRELVVVGVIREPVTWDFSIRFCEDDYTAILGLLLRRASLRALLRALFAWRRHHHWSAPRDEHLAAGRANRELIRASVDQRVQDALRPFDEAPRRRWAPRTETAA
ncbi:MAG: hypothetical protein CALGDGBN_01625 [Pseudomonadales bacterium]|nr:hypothetical protein [Pseudomonadales bacterium]